MAVGQAAEYEKIDEENVYLAGDFANGGGLPLLFCFIFHVLPFLLRFFFENLTTQDLPSSRLLPTARTSP